MEDYMSEVDTSGKLTINKETVDILVANIIPTTKYFESRFDHMQYQINEIKSELEKTNQRITRLEDVMEKRFEQVEDNFKEFRREVDKRFEQVENNFKEFRREVDKRFEQVDKRFESVDRHLVEFRDYGRRCRSRRWR